MEDDSPLGRVVAWRYPRNMFYPRSAYALPLLLAFFLAVGACGESPSETTPAPDATQPEDTVDATAGADTPPEDTPAPADPGEPDDPGPAPVDEGPELPPPPPTCADGLPVRAFVEGATGTLRHEIAGDFTVTRMDGMEWTLSERWTGCDSYVFIPDTLPNSQQDLSSVWERDVAELAKRSPPNMHYFFVSRSPYEKQATSNISGMYDRVAAELQTLSPEQSDAWWFRLHVVQDRAGLLENWLKGVLESGIGTSGFAIDRSQRLRGLGSLADVFRHNAALAAAEAWPWEANMGYAANEAHYYNAEAKREAALAEVEATEVVLFDGQILQGFEETEVELPDAETLSGFDTFEIDVAMRCPDPTKPEAGNCGAWDYLAHLSVYQGEERIELGRFITAYHRETRWVSDVTPMMVHLKEGGPRKLRWEYAPEWNKQPTATWLSLRFSNQKKGVVPAQATFLFKGGAFNAAYNDSFAPVEVPIPADAARVELYAVISGHGMDAGNCAEFCPHAHRFTVNGEAFTEEHTVVGQQDGCVQQLEDGMVPNQWGTWWFGRGGWCPGQQVEPWIVDVTEHVEPGGTATVTYEGLLWGGAPPDNSGNINMTSYLVVYR